ncbi:MAG: homocitrate synthase [bacterium]|nr:homocitrate synthase [bacterium]
MLNREEWDEIPVEGTKDTWQINGEAASRIGKPRKKKVADTGVKVVDTTLRDGEQTAGIVFRPEEKLQIAKLLDQAGIYQIEAGVPAMGGDEQDTVRKIVKAGLKASIMTWNRVVISDIDASIACGVDAVAVSVPTSDIHIEHKLRKDRKWVLENLARSVDYAKSHSLYVSANAEDASRTDLEFLIECIKTARDAGADRFRFCDTVGLLDPYETYRRIRILLDVVGLPIEMHTHNDFGMATANALAGVRAGATYVGATINGLGERAGNAPLEEVVMVLKYIQNIDTGFKLLMLREICDYVAKVSGREIWASKPIVGKNIFLYEAGTTSDGVLKEPTTHEAFAPAEIGTVRQIMIGKHSGSSGLKAKFKEFGIVLDDALTAKIIERVRKKAMEEKRDLFDKELMLIYYSLVGFPKTE